MSSPDAGFERLDRKLVVVAAVLSAAFSLLAAVIGGIALSVGGMSLGLTLLIVVGGLLLIVGFSAGVEYVRWRVTRFRVTDERLELRFEFVVTKRRSLARERIRTVDVTANPVERLFGLAVVVIGTGQHGESGDAEIKLDPVSRERAEQLRVELLRRAGQPVAEQPGDGAIAALRWGWAWYAPLSFLTPAIGAAAVGAVFNVSSWFDYGREPVSSLISDVVRAAALFGYVTVVVGALLAGVIGALLLFVEMWWSYRLDREPGGMLHVRRGLLTTRSISLEERRLRGVEVVEPLGIRLAKAARVDAIATGMRPGGEGRRTDHKTLLPAAPRAVASWVAAAVLREGESPIAAGTLTPHPRAALVRRLRWALAPVLVAFVLLLLVRSLLGTAVNGILDEAVGGMLMALPWVFIAVAVPAAVLLALDAYRSLGHGISGRYLLARRGALRRNTVALQRTGVIGWTVRQSIFQHRAGVLTLVATTAAGAGAYQIPDAAVDEGLAFADAAVPGLLAPFLERPLE